ncbi:MAG TPA: HD domain-containing phosphohydrolase [Pyrinomonadaceae bacterium]|nr:HD domain-containing phosphohydrolase [Pyrinomonadaceae bacterium]
MTANAGSKSRVYQTAITVAGISVWLAAAAHTGLNYTWREQSTLLLAVVPLITLISLFPHVFPMPSGLKFTSENMTFNLSDAILLLVACWYGVAPAVVVGGLEGFTSSRRAVRRLSSNLFSLGMLSLAAGAAASSLDALLRFGFKETGTGGEHTFLAVAVALLVASVVHITTNTGLISTLLALRHGKPILHSWKEFLWAAPMFLPTGAAATMMYLALQHGLLIVFVIGVPLLLTIYLGHRQYHNSVQERIEFIERAQQERIDVMEKAHRQTIEALAVAINAKDEVTHEHVLRVQIYAAGVARILGCNELEVEALKAGALLHDIGKIAVPDYILNKPGKLTAAEFDQMKLHTVAGAQILGRVEFPYPVVPVVRHHHERWDGKGYPDGLKAEEIPLTARILSVVDCFDAVREDRQYRKGLTRDEAVNLIMSGSGTQYDPRVVGTFVTHLPEFEAEIQAHRDVPVPTFGIEAAESLSEAALKVAPAAGLAADDAGGKDSNRTVFEGEEQKALADFTLALEAARTFAEFDEALTKNIAALAPFDSCALTRVSPETGECIVVRATGGNASLLEGRAVPCGEGVTGWALANRKPFCNTDPKLDFPPHIAEHFADYRTLAVFPFVHERETYGTIALYSASLAEYTAAHQRLLQEAANVAAATLAAGFRNTKRDATDSTTVALPLSTPTPLESQLTH